MNISIIVAVDENFLIGNNNNLPWHLPADMKFFKEKTTGHCVITGRKNYESIPEKFRPLPNRTNIVITRQQNYSAQGAVVVGTMEDALQKAKQNKDDEIFIIGGAEIFKLFLPVVNKIYLTTIHHKFTGNIFFPDLNFSEWKLIKKETFEPDEKNKYSFSFNELVRKIN